MESRRLKVIALTALLLGMAAVISVSFIAPSPTTSLSNGDDVNLEAHTADSGFEDRYRAVVESLAVERHVEWSGAYKCQESAGTVVTLYLSASAGFVWQEQGPSWWQNNKGYGSAAMKAGRVMLAGEQLIKQPAPSGLPDSDRRLPGCLSADLYQVSWGSRHYLIPSDKMFNFCEVFNSGRLSDLNQFLLKDGDEKEAVSGRPDVPDEYVRFINRSRLLQ